MAALVRIVAIVVPLLLIRGLYGAFLILAGRGTKWSEISRESDKATILAAALCVASFAALVFYALGRLLLR
jgi:hypothetical protein